MKLAVAALALVALAACPPQVSGPEAIVTAIYEPLVTSKGQAVTPIDAIPMTADLKDLVARAQTAAADTMPVIDGDIAGNCQDCTGFSDLKIGPTADNAAATDSHQIIEANFKLFQNEPRTVHWDMIKSPEGWLVDNILSEGFNLRSIANTVIAEAATPQPGPEGDEAVECLAYVTLQIDALKKAEPPVDTALLDAANTAWRKKAEGLFSADGLAQYFASSVAVLDDTPAEELATKATECTTKAPANQ